MRGLRATNLSLGAGATSVHWIGGHALFALSDGGVASVSAGGATQRIDVHDGAILSACLHPSGDRLVTGGDDGRINVVAATGEVATLAAHRRWVDHLVANPDSKLVIAGVAKQAIVYRDDGELHRFDYPSTLGGIALDQKGRRLAASHYGGATLRYALAADDKGQALTWAGSHLAVTISPDSQYVITAMQENALHGWRLPEKTDLRMDGYPAKTRALSWDRRGRWLATSGADSAIVWLFVGKLGPQGKPPLQLGHRNALVTAVAFHPHDERLAIGYADGAAVLVQLDNTAVEVGELGDGAVTSLAWNADGHRLALADESGRGAVIEL
jgi:WD40 repeat protein